MVCVLMATASGSALNVSSLESRQALRLLPSDLQQATHKIAKERKTKFLMALDFGEKDSRSGGFGWLGLWHFKKTEKSATVVPLL